MLRIFILGLIVPWVSGGQTALAQQDEREAVLAAERRTVELSRDSGLTKALLQSIHPSAALLWPGAPAVVGGEDIRRLLTRLESDSLFFTWQPLEVELARDSSLAVSWGVAVAAARYDPRSTELGRYISVWRRDSSRWTIAALVFTGIRELPAAALPADLPRALPALKPAGLARPFAEADVAFARLAGDSGASIAFKRWAAPNAVMFSGRGLLIRGPEEIERAVAGPAAWQWHPVAGGAARSGDMGWTVGQAVIAAKAAKPSYSKYLTVWIRSADGTVRFLADGGNARPAASN
jgi:hypothetical protein